MSAIPAEVGNVYRYTGTAGLVLPEAVIRETRTVSPNGEKYLMRDDGVIYPWNPRLAARIPGPGEHSFRPIRELPREEMERRKAAESRRNTIAVNFREQLAAQEERMVQMRAEAAARLRSAQNPVISDEDAAKAQVEYEQNWIVTGDSDRLAEFAREKFGIELRIGEADLMRAVVMDLWDGTLKPADWKVGEPSDWRSAKACKDFLQTRLFVKVAADTKVDEMRALIRSLLDDGNAQHDPQ